MSFRLAAAAVVALALAVPAGAASRTFTITSFDRVRIDGPYQVRLTTNVAPFARASGSSESLDRLSVEVQGRTLIVRNNPSAWGGYPGESPGPVEITVGTHDLANAWVNGSGSLAIDSVRGQTFDLSLQGSGSVAIERVDVDRLRAGVNGAGSAVFGGRAGEATLIVGGTGSLDASALTVDHATLGASGSPVLKVTATDTAKVSAEGTATVEVAGNPACTVRASGSAVVTGCR